MQQEVRLKRLFIALFVGTFLLLAGMIAGFGFGIYRPRQAAMDVVQGQIDQKTTTANGFGAAQVAYVKAQEDQKATEAQLAFFRGSAPSFKARYHALYIDLGSDTDTPMVKNTKLYLTFKRWLNEYYSDYGLILQGELDKAVLASGVSYASPSTGTNGAASPTTGNTTGSGPTNGRPSIAIAKTLAPTNPEDVPTLIQTNGLLTPVPPLSMAVHGDLGSILNFFQIITSDQSEILKTVGNIKLDGNSPNITASFTVTPYLVATGPGVKVTATGGAASGGAASGAPAGGAAPGGIPGPGPAPKPAP